jgi:hypothetical protein
MLCLLRRATEQTLFKLELRLNVGESDGSKTLHREAASRRTARFVSNLNMPVFFDATFQITKHLL